MDLIIQATYSGNLIASLAVNKYTLPVNDLKELVQQTSHRVGVVGGSSHEYVFKVSVIFLFWIISDLYYLNFEPKITF